MSVVTKLHFSSFKMLFCIKNEHPQPGDVPLFLYGLDRRSGQALCRLRATEEAGFHLYRALTYAELIEAARENQVDLTGLNADTWRAYLLLRPQDQLIFASSTAGAGSYHDEIRYGLQITTDGYFLQCRAGSPMASMQDDSHALPIGYFAEKSPAQLRQWLENAPGYIPRDSLCINDRDLELLIETDAYRRSQLPE